MLPTHSAFLQVMLPSLFLLLGSLSGWNTNNRLFVDAFTTRSINPNHAFINDAIKHISSAKKETNIYNRKSSTAIFARNKNGGRKVPKMPTLPVSTPPSSATSSASTNPSDDTNPDFYSTSKPASTSTMVVMDVENIRGATSFRISHEALLTRIRLWREDRLSIASSRQSGENAAFLEPLIWTCDHGMSSSIHHFSPFSENDSDGVAPRNKVLMPHNFGAMFAGPGGRTADDVIVDLVELRCGGIARTAGNGDDTKVASYATPEPQAINSPRNTTIVITADARLISRCQQARRKSCSLSDVIFVEPVSLLQQLERYRISANEEESLFGQNGISLTMSPPMNSSRKPIDDSSKRNDGKTNTMTSFKDSAIAMDQHAKFQARFQNKKKSLDTDEPRTETSKSVAKDEEEAQTEQDTSDSNAAALEAQLKTEQIRRQLLLSDAYYLARPSKNVRGRRAHTTTAAVHAKYKNRNISKKQQKKLYAKRFGRKRKEDMATAAVKRKELAAKLQLNLQNASSDSSNDDGSDYDDEVENGMLLRSIQLLETLLGKFEEERLIMCKIPSFSSDNTDNAPLTTADSDPTTFLGLDASSGKVGSDDKWDPLGSTLTVPLPKVLQNSKDGSIPPLRIVVISDTHGFEGALSRFADPTISSDEDPSKMHSDDFLLPQADVLLHCGDFAASGSRKMQRAAARRLDDFLARQTHIPEKIVIKGNHDPDSPAKVLFPGSKALYVRSSSTLMVNGVSFALEPFSRRMAFRSIRRRTSSYAMSSSLPKCDILVSHEPPKNVLDLTYHGFSAGSMYLRELVEHAEHKPRLWLCGHIHESRGVITKHFHPPGKETAEYDEAKISSTMVINASNANSGRANRLVSGAVVVEVDRHVSTAGGGERAESTLKLRQVDHLDDAVVDPTNLGSTDSSLAGLGEDLELYVTRPGVRRRKGLPQSMRQQLKQARSTLTTTGDEDCIPTVQACGFKVLHDAFLSLDQLVH